jgi:hypothetical protein
MRGAESSASLVHFQPPVTGIYTAVCPKDRYSICGRLFHQALGRRNVVKPCALPAGIGTEFAAVSLNYHILSLSTVPVFVLIEIIFSYSQTFHLAKCV